LREKLEADCESDPSAANSAKLADCVTNQEIENAAKKYAFQGFVMSSAKEKKGLNKVFHTAFKVVFQMKNMDNNRVQPGSDAATADPSKPPGPSRSGAKEGGCCGGKKK